MKIRTISGAVFTAIVAIFFALRQFVDYRLFNIFIYFLMFMGTFEVARALRPFTNKATFICAIIFAIISVPIYCLFNYLLPIKNAHFVFLILSLGFSLIFLIISSKKNVNGIFDYIKNLLPFVYPALLILAMLTINDLGAYGFIPMLLVFVISPFSDVMAYLVGMTYNKFKKGNAKKLCPKLSPKKTWAGAFGAVLGGTVGSLIVYFIFNPQVNFFSPILLFILLGLVGSIFTIIGDLMESAIKRKVGIKDMGKIMPGHGGVMDRIDGISFSSTIIMLVFLLV